MRGLHDKRYSSGVGLFTFCFTLMSATDYALLALPPAGCGLVSFRRCLNTLM